MAEDCMTRAWALAIATAACVILPAALVYNIVRIAAARHLGATIALSFFLVIWVTASAAYYPRVCADIVRWSPMTLVRSLRGQPGGSGGGAMLPRFAVPSWQEDRGNMAVVRRELPNVRDDRPGALFVPLLFVARRRQEDDGGMNALPREAPAAARRGALAVDGDTLSSSHEQRRDGEPPLEPCAVCLCDVDQKAETAAWLPTCLHMFHRHCIDQWLHQHGHSTCPICRCDAFAASLPPEQST